MPSPQPKSDRCGANVVDKVGLEVHADPISAPDDVDVGTVADEDDEGRWTFTDDVIETVTVVRDGTTETVEPDYITVVVDFLRNGFDTDALQLATGHTIQIEDDDPYITNERTDHQGYCMRYPMDNGRCYVHGGVSGGAPEGNTNAMTHGLRARRSNYYEELEEEDRAFIEAMVDSWLDDAPFDRDNMAKVSELYRIAIDQLRLWKATDEYVDDGLVKEVTVDYDPEQGEITAEDENPVNLPYSRLDRDLYSKLKDLDVLSDDDDDSADVTVSLAQKLSGEVDES